MARSVGSALFSLLLAGAMPAQALTPALPAEGAPLGPRILVETPSLAGRELARFLDDLEARGVRVPVALSGVGCIVEDDANARGVLAGDPRVALVREAPRASAAFRSRTENSDRPDMLQLWNLGFAPSPAPAIASRENETLCAGATRLEEALRERGATPRCGPSGSGRVHFASGRAAVNLVFPESEGPGTLADWTVALQTTIAGELVRALQWWNLKSGGALTFVVINRGSAETPYEPGLLTMADEYLYLSGMMQSLGYSGSCAYEQIDAMNEETRLENGANWGFTQVVIHANQFSGSGALAYAYLGGPHTVALSGNGSLGTGRLDRVIAHEVGHIFQALDEYLGGCEGCSARSGYLDVLNLNCVTCQHQSGKCVMRGGAEYGEQEMDEMETKIRACEHTLGMAGIRDANRNGVLDVRETIPETTMSTALPDTMFGSGNVLVEGRAWDQPYANAPPQYEPVTLNVVTNVEFSVDGRKWSSSSPVDGYWSSREENFELRLPEAGGGMHRLWLRAVNSVGARDPTGVKADFFVYDVILHQELEALEDGADLVLIWRVSGSDLGSTFKVTRAEVGVPNAPEVVVAEVASRGVINDRYVVRDTGVRAANEYLYKLEVDIPGKGRKSLGTAHGKTFLADPPPGQIAISSPNPATGPVIITVTVPRGPVPDDGGAPPPGEDDGGVINPPETRDGTDPPPWGGNSVYWRDVELAVFDVTGRLVKNLGTSRRLELTRFNTEWDGTSQEGTQVPPGIYFLQTKVGEIRQSTRITILR